MANWLDRPCPVSETLQNDSQNFSFSFIFKYETIVRSSTLSFGHSDPDPSSVIAFKSQKHLALERSYFLATVCCNASASIKFKIFDHLLLFQPTVKQLCISVVYYFVIDGNSGKGKLISKCLFGAFTDRKNVTDFLYLVLHLACQVTCYFRLFSLIFVSVLTTSINVLSKSKSKN